MNEKLSTKVTTGKIRFSFCNVWEPRAMEGSDDAKYSATLLIPKSDKVTVSKINEAIKAAKENGTKLWGGKIPANLASPVHDGDGTRDNGEPYGPECANCYVITASSKQRPGVVDENINEILTQSDFYSGCYGRAGINFFAYNKAGKRGIGCGLNNVQKLTDGDPLGGRTSPVDDFSDGNDSYDDYSDMLG